MDFLFVRSKTSSENDGLKLSLAKDRVRVARKFMNSSVLGVAVG